MRYIFLCITTLCSLFCQAQIVVEPMLSTFWNQNSPYRDMCPENKVGVKTPPGCGAIALGQIWNYYRLTNHANGIASYTSKGISDEPKDLDYEIVVDFKNKSFDWENILDKYTNNASPMQKNAIADYICQIGNAIHMQYRTNGSSPANDGQTLWGMHHHLGASPRAIWHYRRYYSTEEWLSMINRNLENGHPVFYAGVWYSTSTSSKKDYDRTGHIYVIDGINEKGEYHFKYGANMPSQDKYTSLDYINQSNGECYPGGRDICYNFRQVMFDQLYPVENGKYLTQAIVGNRPLILNGDPKLTDVTISKSHSFYIETSILNYSVNSDNLDVAFWAMKDNVRLYSLSTKENIKLGPGYYLENTKFTFSIPKELKDGEYDVKLFSKHHNTTEEWQEALECVPFSFSIKINNDDVNIHTPINRTADPVIVLKSPIQEIENKFESNYPGKLFQLKFENPSIYNYEDTLRITFYTPQGIKIKKHPIAVYESCSVEYRILIPTALIDLKSYQGIDVEYYVTSEQRWKRVMTKEEYSGIKGNRVDSDELTIYNLNGTKAYQGKSKNILQQLPKGTYILRQNGQSRKIII